MTTQAERLRPDFRLSTLVLFGAYAVASVAFALALSRALSTVLEDAAESGSSATTEVASPLSE